MTPLRRILSSFTPAPAAGRCLLLLLKCSTSLRVRVLCFGWQRVCPVVLGCDASSSVRFAKQVHMRDY